MPLLQDGNTCLHLKEALKNPDMVNLLVEAFWKNQISVGLTNKVLASCNSQLDSLASYPVTILYFISQQNGLTPLVLCCQVGDICLESARLLVTHGAAVDGSPNVR